MKSVSMPSRSGEAKWFFFEKYQAHEPAMIAAPAA
jgi:hypothetical protein